MNSTEIQLLANSEIQRYNLRKKERQNADKYKPRAFNFSAYQTESNFRLPYDFYFGEPELETVFSEQIPTQAFGSNLIYSRENVCLYAQGNHVHAYQRDVPVHATYKGHNGLITDVQHIPKELIAQSQSQLDEEGIHIATCDQNNKVCIWAYFPRRENSTGEKSPKASNLFKTYFTMNLGQEPGHAVKLCFASTDARKTLRMFILLSTGQLNCYDLDSDLENSRSSTFSGQTRTVVTQCESASRRLCVSTDYVVLSTRERVTGFCPYTLQPIFDFDCSSKQVVINDTLQQQPANSQTINFLHIIDRSTVVIATDTTLQLWNVLQQKPILIQLIRMELGAYKLQGVTPASNSEYIHVQHNMLETLKSSFSEMVESEAEELTRDLSTFRDLKWCLIACPFVEGPYTGGSNSMFNSHTATPTGLPMFMFHLVYGHKGWTVDYILPFDVASAAISFHVVPHWNKTEDGRSQYTVTAMHSQYLGNMKLTNTKEVGKTQTLNADSLLLLTEKAVEEELNTKEITAEVSEAMEKVNLSSGECAAQTVCSPPEMQESVPMELLSTLLETTAQQSSQLNALNKLLQTRSDELVAATSEVEQTVKESLDASVKYIQKKIDQIRHRLKKHTAQSQERLQLVMSEFATRCVEECNAAIYESFRGIVESDQLESSKVSSELKRISAALSEKVLKHSQDISLRVIEAEHEKVRADLKQWRVSLNDSIEGAREGIMNLNKCSSAGAHVIEKPSEKFSFDLAENLIDSDHLGKALTLASETDSLESLVFCFDKIKQTNHEKSLVFTRENVSDRHAARILDILSSQLDDLKTIGVRLEWMQILLMSEIFMVNDEKLEKVKSETVERLQTAKANSRLTSPQLYSMKILINILRASI
ncbi:methyl-accepting chemotaxis sensory transducer [Perkinsela sp. CCAP 1560/4]|nr:methyl-accepting chemotaxis sensory transducer [Perkinsela sp. CCAP 1560/4]|eukprot:KNH03776.1 methyl-accepting chemotaxis sensory transducer [Perkinsela sp. CCAP 1560/4]